MKVARPEEVLLIAQFDPSGLPCIKDIIAYLARRSDFRITVLNLFEYRHPSGRFQLSSNIDFRDYHAVVLHNTVSYYYPTLGSLDAHCPVSFREYDGVKILLKQDENLDSQKIDRFLVDNAFDVLFTCLGEEELDKVYPLTRKNGVAFFRMLTGYVTPNLRQIGSRDHRERRVDIGYRGSIQPLSFGWLCYEKRKIGEDVRAIATDAGLKVNISSRWEDRFSESQWFDFLSDCRATLGVESGASVFDLDGSLGKLTNELEQRLAHLEGTEEYDLQYLQALAPFEGNVYYNQISPRHFEAAATHTLQVLYPGNYSGVFSPGQHYVELQRDLSNFGDVVDAVNDPSRWSELTTRAFEEIVLNESNWIESFVKQVDEVLCSALTDKRKVSRPCRTSTAERTNVLLLAEHEPHLDPRLYWTSDAAPEGVCVHQLCVGRHDSELNIEEHRKGRDEYFVVTVPRCKHGEFLGFRNWLQSSFTSQSQSLGQGVLTYLFQILSLWPEQRNDLLGSFDSDEQRSSAFEYALKHVIETNLSLIKHAEIMKGFEAIIATDMSTLPAAFVLRERFQIPVILDAHEYWPESNSEQFEWERDFWRDVHDSLVREVDHVFTVSPGLQKVLQAATNREVGCVPNAALLKEAVEPCALGQHLETEKCAFLYLGTFCAKRGLEVLIENWSKCNEHAVLFLQGKRNHYSQELEALAKSTGLLGKRIFFLDPAREEDLVRVAARADVGLIPYDGNVSKTYFHCSPNKLSQYMAAGIPIIANRLAFVGQVLAEGDCGTSVSFSDAAAFVDVIDQYATNHALREAQGRNAREHFATNFNWELVSKPLYDAATSGVSNSGLSHEFQLVDVDRSTTENRQRKLDRAIVYRRYRVLYDDLKKELHHQASAGKSID